MAMATHAGMTTDEFSKIVIDWISTAKHPKTGRLYREMVFQPMLELLEYLRAKDFKTFKRHGIIFTPDNKDIAIFPGKINGKYYALHRPASAEYNFRDIWIAESSDLIHWGKHRSILQTRPGYWDNGRIGCSAVPFLTDAGWVEIYHGSSKENRYCLGVSIHDKDDPSWVLARSKVPLMAPETDYELSGFFGNVIFNCGVLFEDDMVKIYYGAADETICYAEVSLAGILANVK